MPLAWHSWPVYWFHQVAEREDPNGREINHRALHYLDQLPFPCPHTPPPGQQLPLLTHQACHVSLVASIRDSTSGKLA